MTVLTTVSAVAYQGDGTRQIFPFGTDTEMIPHESADEVVVRVDGEILPRDSYSISVEPNATILTLHAPPAIGAAIELERHTPLLQPKQFRRDSDWDLDAVEAAFDRQMRAMQDAFYRISRIEKVIHVEHRTVDVPTGITAEHVAGLGDTIAAVVREQIQPAPAAQMSDEIVRNLADAIAVEMDRMRQQAANDMSDLQSRVARLEQIFGNLYAATATKDAA